MAQENLTPITEPIKKKDKYKWKIIGVLLILTLASSAAAVFLYKQNLAMRQNPNKITEGEIEKVVAKVSKLILLPEDEKPTLATVTDPGPLRDQPFFAKAKSGDQVLLYAGARKAILYDPVANKIVEVASLNLG